MRSTDFHGFVFQFDWVFSRVFCLQRLSDCVYFLFFDFRNFRPVHFFDKFSIILCLFLSLHCFHSFLVFLKFFLLLFLKNIPKELTSKSLFVLLCLLFNVRIIVFSLLSKLKWKFSFTLLINFLMHFNFVSINRSIKFSFLL